jgi:hypothetical protein
MKTNNATKKVLELRAAHARDTTFFAYNGIEVVEALDYSVATIEVLDKVTKEKD